MKQVGMFVALSSLRTWTGTSVAFLLWWIATAQEPLRLGFVVNVLACFVLFQVGKFGIGLVGVWDPVLFEIKSLMNQQRARKMLVRNAP